MVVLFHRTERVRESTKNKPQLRTAVVLVSIIGRIHASWHRCSAPAYRIISQALTAAGVLVVFASVSVSTANKYVCSRVVAAAVVVVD